MKDDMHQAGIRSDRPMTYKEIYTAAANYNAVKRASEFNYNPNSKVERFLMGVLWVVVGFGILYVAVAVVMTIVDMF